MLAYLSRYTHRVAISNRRLLAFDDNGVTFKWMDYRAKGRPRYKRMTLATDEFIRRFLLPVLPAGFHPSGTTGSSPMAAVPTTSPGHANCSASPSGGLSPPRQRAAYDRVVSIGMFEHVGRRHFVDYFRAVSKLLKPGGRAPVHSIIKPTPPPTNAWLKKYIFPGGQIPQLAEMTASARAARLVLPHVPFVHEGSHYATTLWHWRRRFNDNFASLDHTRYDQRFRQLWSFYLAG